MKPIATALLAYGVFLVLAGLTGYLSNPEKAKTALLSGGTFGLLHVGLGLLALRGWRPALKTALVTASLLGAVFVWRATVTWMAVLDGNPEKRTAALIISAMLAATCILLVRLRSAGRRLARRES